MSRKICFVSGSRAEYGLLRWLIEEVRDDDSLTLQLVVTGAHLSTTFGRTCQEIEEDGFIVDREVEILNDEDTPLSITRSIGLGLTKFGSVLSELEPDLLVVLGDRYEIFAAVSAALVLCIPVAHLHGGELTAGAIDDALRHAITKMSHLHFVATAEYYRRVLQLGENPERVFLVGGFGVDSIHQSTLLSRKDVEASLGFNLGKRNLLITFHPPSLDTSLGKKQLQALFSALDEFPDIHLLFTSSNADAGGRELLRMVESYVNNRANAILHASLGQIRYFSCIALFDGVIGNSSSGLTEVPTFRKGTVNIGDRQQERVSGSTVINCPPTVEEIVQAIDKMYSPQFQATLKNALNPYGSGGASKKVLETIKHYPLEGITKKIFFDLEVGAYERNS